MRKRFRILILVTSLWLASTTTLICGPSRTLQQFNADPPPITISENADAGSVNQPATPTGRTIDVSVGPNFSFTFSPSTVNILVGDTVRWTWAGSNHTVTSGSPCTVNSGFCSPNDINCSTAAASNPPTTYSHTFTQPGTFQYFCRIHAGSE